MEDSWLLSAPMSLNANTLTLETKETKSQRELYIGINEMTNTLEHFGKKKEQQNQQLQQNQPTGSLLNGNSR